MQENSIARDVLMLLIGAGISLIASTATFFLERWWNRSGKLQLYFLLMDNEGGDRYPLGFVEKRSIGQIEFNVPISLEIVNLCNTSRIIRNVELSMYNGNRRVKRLAQIMHSEYTPVSTSGKFEKVEIEYGSENNSYSFVVQPKSIQKQILLFCDEIKMSDEERRKYFFDNLRLEYYDEKNHLKSYKIYSVENA